MMRVGMSLANSLIGDAARHWDRGTFAEVASITPWV